MCCYSLMCVCLCVMSLLSLMCLFGVTFIVPHFPFFVWFTHCVFSHLVFLFWVFRFVLLLLIRVCICGYRGGDNNNNISNNISNSDIIVWTTCLEYLSAHTRRCPCPLPSPTTTTQSKHRNESEMEFAVLSECGNGVLG